MHQAARSIVGTGKRRACLCQQTVFYGNEEANTVFAARTLQAASQKAPDSMVAFLSNVPVEDQARLALISAINEGLNRPAGSDSSLIEEPDTTFESY